MRGQGAGSSGAAREGPGEEAAMTSLGVIDEAYPAGGDSGGPGASEGGEDHPGVFIPSMSRFPGSVII